MASGFYGRGLRKLLDGTINGGTATWKVMAVNSTYAYDPDHTTVDDGSANDPQSKEVVATNYVRKAAVVTFSYLTAVNKVVLLLGDLAWVALGGAVNDTIGGFVLYVDAGGADTGNELIGFYDITDTPTNGSDISMDNDNVNGNLQIGPLA